MALSVLPAGLEPLPPGSSQTASSSTSSPSAKRGVHNKAHQPNKGRKRDKGTEDATGTAAPGSSDSKKKLTAAYWNLNDRNKASSVADPTSRAANMVKLGLEDPSRFEIFLDNHFVFLLVMFFLLESMVRFACANSDC